MSVNAPQFFAVQYATNIQLKLQQKGSHLRPHVMSGSYVGKSAQVVEQIDAVSMQPVTTRFAPMGRVDAAMDSRWVYPSDFDLPQYVDNFDKLRMLTDPQSKMVEDAVAAAGRSIDDVLLAAFKGTNKTGIDGGTSTVRTDNGGADVAVNWGSSADCGLTVAKLRKAKLILMANQVDLASDQIICVVNAATHDNLLAEIQVVNTDYNSQNGVPVLQDGIIKRYLGIDFVYCERLLLDATDTDATIVPVYAKSGAHLGLWNDISTSISIRHDLQSEPYQTYVYMTCGGTRLEEKKFAHILCE